MTDAARVPPRRQGMRLTTRRLRLVAPLLLGIANCSQGNVTGSQPATGSGPDLVLVQAIDVGTVQPGAQVLGRDGAYSALFQGQSVWLYSDTFLGHPNAQNNSLISDSWAWTSNLNAANGITGFQQTVDPSGDPAMFLLETVAEQQYNLQHRGNTCQVQPCNARWALWLSSIIEDPARSRALIFYNFMYADLSSFNRLGTSVASWSGISQTPQRPVINPSAVHPDLLFSQSEPDFGAATLIDGGLLYAYSCGTSSTLDKPCLLGRVDPARVLDRSAWTYYAGGGNWSASVGAAVSVFSGLDILNVSWNSYLQRFVAIYAAVLSNNVMVRTATRPEGPWSSALQIFTARAPSNGGTTYDAQSHPEFNVGGGQTMYVSYSRGTGTFTSEIRLVAVEFRRP